MKILISLVILVAALMFFPHSQALSSPWTDIWAAITDLQSQINDMVLTPGPVGATGASGSMGPPGPSLSGINKDLMYVVRSAYAFVTPGLATIVRAQCHDNNDPLISGGYQIAPPQFNHVYMVSNSGSPTDGIASWTVAAITDATVNLDLGQIQAEAYCLQVD